MPRKAKALPGPANVEGFLEVAEGVHAFIGGGGATNFGLVLTEEKPVVIDNDIRARKAFVAGMRKITRKSPGLALNTHHNFDHTSDNGYYHGRGAVSVGQESVRLEMEREENEGVWVTQMAGRPQKVEHLIGRLRVAPPMVTFEKKISIRYGGRLFEMIHVGHCHTKGDAVAWMPEEKILFTGDLLDYRTHPVARLGSFLNWMEAIPRLKKFPAKRLIPGHGPIPARPAPAAWDEFRGYMTKLRSRAAAALKENPTPAKAAPNVRMDEYRNWFRPNLVPQNALLMAKELRRKNRGRQAHAAGGASPRK